MFSNFLESLYEGIGDDDDADENDDDNNPKSSTERHDSKKNVDRLSSISPEEEAQARGVKDDLTELGHTLTRQFRGVANFLAPLPDGSSSSDLSNPRLNQSRSLDPGLNQSRSSDPRLNQSLCESCVGGSDTPEKGIRVRSWNSETTVSDEKRVENVCNDPEEEEEEEEETDEEEEEEEEEEIDAVALTDEVLAFARNIAMHPETWLDFPLDPDEDLDDLEMSDAQRGHALAIERLAPRLAALRIELCPCHMSVGYFWKVYFVLLLSRLNKLDAQLLSSPQVMEARALWMKELQNQTHSSKEGRDILEEETLHRLLRITTIMLLLSFCLQEYMPLNLLQSFITISKREIVCLITLSSQSRRMRKIVQALAKHLKIMTMMMMMIGQKKKKILLILGLQCTQ